MFDEAIENVRKTIRQLSKYCSLTQCMTIDYIYMHVKCNVSVCVCLCVFGWESWKSFII